MRGINDFKGTDIEAHEVLSTGVVDPNGLYGSLSLFEGGKQSLKKFEDAIFAVHHKAGGTESVSRNTDLLNEKGRTAANVEFSSAKDSVLVKVSSPRN